MTKEYIERETLQKELSVTDWYSVNRNGELVLGASTGETALFKASDMFTLLRNVPAENITPVRQGMWKLVGGLYHCTICDCKVERGSCFCPNCGADMRGVYK